MSGGHEAFDAVMAQVDAAMVVVTTIDGRERAGCLVGFHSQAGMEPDALAVWLSKANHTFRVASLADVFAVHFLTTEDLELARLFGTRTGDDIDKFTECRWHPGPGGVPLLDDCAHRVVGRKQALVDTGTDHVCLVLDPIESVSAGAFSPLRLSDVVDLAPGHPANERPRPPTTRAGEAAADTGSPP